MDTVAMNELAFQKRLVREFLLKSEAPVQEAGSVERTTIYCECCQRCRGDVSTGIVENVLSRSGQGLADQK
jgi:hypothetical protein